MTSPIRSRKVRTILKLEAEIARLSDRVAKHEVRARPLRLKVQAREARMHILLNELTGTQLSELKRATMERDSPNG